MKLPGQYTINIFTEAMVFLLFDTGSHYIFQTDLELAIWPRLPLNTQFCLTLPKAGITGMCHM